MSVPVNRLECTANPNSEPTMYTPLVPNTLPVAFHVPEPVPRTGVYREPGNYGNHYGLTGRRQSTHADVLGQLLR